ncbi:KH domain-containing protein [Patescibacteria group bacterium]|nr:KH domain-containing protein [Patescibacteria group bacterium]MCL5797181.1 KH domain-containing protein [Patescibacteria group bacterium]
MKKKDKEVKLTSDIKTTVLELMDRLHVEGSVDVEEEKSDPSEEANHFKVVIQTNETGLLIGRHGETLNSLQLILGVVLYKKMGKWIRVILDVGDYRKVREESIKEMVGRIVAEVESIGQPVTLPYLTPLERRIVHIMLADNPKIMSESTGEGKERRVTIKPRQQG